MARRCIRILPDQWARHLPIRTTGRPTALDGEETSENISRKHRVDSPYGHSQSFSRVCLRGIEALKGKLISPRSEPLQIDGFIGSSSVPCDVVRIAV